MLDFNFAYNPSAHYDPGWVCTLAPANGLPMRIAAGERFAGWATDPQLRELRAESPRSTRRCSKR